MSPADGQRGVCGPPLSPVTRYRSLAFLVRPAMPFFEHRRHTFPVSPVIASPRSPEQTLQQAEEEEEEQQREQEPEAKAERVEAVMEERAVVRIRHGPRRRWGDLPALDDTPRDAGVVGNSRHAGGQDKHKQDT